MWEVGVCILHTGNWHLSFLLASFLEFRASSECRGGLPGRPEPLSGFGYVLPLQSAPSIKIWSLFLPGWLVWSSVCWVTELCHKTLLGVLTSLIPCVPPLLPDSCPESDGFLPVFVAVLCVSLSCGDPPVYPYVSWSVCVSQCFVYLSP